MLPAPSLCVFRPRVMCFVLLYWVEISRCSCPSVSFSIFLYLTILSFLKISVGFSPTSDQHSNTINNLEFGEALGLDPRFISVFNILNLK